jgi:choline dehydrogenase
MLEAGTGIVPEASVEPSARLGLLGSPVDWAYQTTPQLGTKSVMHAWPRGKMLGGSSGINGMFHLRGHRSSYDAWEKAGATGWNFDTLLPYLKRSERAEGRDPVWRGTTGAMRVAPVPKSTPLIDAAYQAAREIGHPAIDDANGEQTEGVFWIDCNIADGKRQSAADGYLRPVLHRPNLTVTTDALAQRVLFDGRRCHGVQYSAGGQPLEAHVDREVVVAAGAIGSPQLLLLSGIGPAGDLNNVGVELTADLPGVGKNLHDHVSSWVTFSATQELRDGRVRTPGVLFRSHSPQDPDLQLIFVNVGFPVRRPSDTVEPWGTPEWLSRVRPGYTIVFSLMSPYSRGTVRLASADPKTAPIIDPAYLSDERDLDRMVTGMRHARELGEADALRRWRDKELTPGTEVQSDVACREFIRSSASTYFHPVGTCAIGTGESAVVDPQLRVYGVEGLRVADASVMPSIVSANTNAAVMGIAERAAALLVGRV